MELIIGLYSGGFAGLVIGQRHLVGLGFLMISIATALTLF